MCHVKSMKPRSWNVPNMALTSGARVLDLVLACFGSMSILYHPMGSSSILSVSSKRDGAKTVCR